MMVTKYLNVIADVISWEFWLSHEDDYPSFRVLSSTHGAEFGGALCMSELMAACSLEAKVLDWDRKVSGSSPSVGALRSMQPVGLLSKALNPTLLQGILSPA